MKARNARTARWLLAGALVAVAAGCGSDAKTSSTTAAPAASTAASASAGTTGGGAAGAPITLAVNPWTGSAVNANVAKIVLESKLNTKVTLTDIDENATWPGMDSDSIDAVLEVWPSGHAADVSTYIDQKKTVVDMGVLGPDAKIGWYIPTFMLKDHPELATWEGFKDPKVAKLFATAETGDLGQFLMGDPSYVSYDEQIIANLKLPLKFVVAGSEAALITAIKQSIADKTPLLMQFWQPHWLQSQVDLTQVKLPDVTPACTASAAAADGKYACDYPVDHLFKAASVKLETKNPAAFKFLSKMQLTTDQQNEIAAKIDGDGMKAADAAKAWVDANPDIVNAWLS
ncbi:MAG: glycine/betaine transporter substrate-binding protein [Ilumatobacteraceae bacterium]|nr:glycine/betaine transporter substrate-binding protein [Ilumatobacteraceae bacterium]